MDARQLPNNHSLETDLCIIGAGAAGITLARELAGQAFRVCLLESGGLEPDQDTQGLCRGKNIGLPYFPLHAARLRYFGGTTNHWGGMCAPFEGIDFEPRPWIPHSGWPFPKSTIDPYYKRAASLVLLSAGEWNPATWNEPGKPQLPLVGSRVVTAIGLQADDKLRRFGRTHRDEVIQAHNITTLLYANASRIEADATARRVRRVHVACSGGNRLSITAHAFILAAGGIENARLLLLSNEKQVGGLGHQNNLVGRFFMDHPTVQAGILRPASPHLPFDFYLKRRVRGSIVTAGLRLSPEVQQREQLVNVDIGFEPVYEEVYTTALRSAGLTSLRHILRRLRKGEVPPTFGRHLGNVVTDLEEVAVAAYGGVRFGGRYPIDHVKLMATIDPAPNKDSRVVLGPETDQFGQRRVQLDWRLSAIDKQSVRRTVEIIATELGRAGLGRVQIGVDHDHTIWPADLVGSFHHIGTTRMNDDPKRGVVDRDCRVHGVHNLFVAGSSVFPTAGSGTPTLMIVALCLRLADHVKRVMR